MAETEAMKNRRKVVLASGTFDLLHMGHVKYLEEAKKAGGENAKLIVIVARDKTAKKRKGTKPIVSEDHRRALVEALKVVDEAILGFEDFNMEKVIEKIRPDIIVVGHDQDSIIKQVQEVVARKGLNIEVARTGKFGKNELNSSLKIKRKIIELYRR
ncbi:MAG: FAD synthase [Candidatus Bathyarchaeota archaeon]|jgi:FAD synthetase